MPELSQEQRQQLVDKLLTCPCMATYIKRERLVQELPSAIRHKVSLSASLDTRMQVLDIVNSCLHFEGGLAELCRVVKFFDHATTAFSELVVFLAGQGFGELVARIAAFSISDGVPEKETSQLLNSPAQLRLAIRQYLELLLDPVRGVDDLDTMRWGGDNYIPLPATQKEPEPNALGKQRLEQMKNSRPDSYSEQEILVEYWLTEAKKENEEKANSRYKSGGKAPEEESKPVENLLEALAQHRRVALLGGPGAGKTTTLRRIAIDTARQSLGLLTAQADSSAKILPDGLLLPIYLPLGGYNVATQSVPSLIGSALDRRVAGLGSAEAVAWLAQGQHFFYLFDGVNEMPTNTLAQSILALRQEVEKNNQRAIFACREEEFAGYFRDFARLLVRPLDPARIEQFVQARGVAGLLDVLDGQLALQDLAQIPYFLNLMCFLYARQGSLPSTRPQLLYQFAHAALLDSQRRDNKTLSEPAVQGILNSLSHLAYQMIAERKGTRVEQSWAEQQEQMTSETVESGLLSRLMQVVWLAADSDANAGGVVPVKGKVVKDKDNGKDATAEQNEAVKGLRFAHQIVLEWLAARSLEQLLGREVAPSARGKVLKKLAQYERWEQSILLLLEGLAWNKAEGVKPAELDGLVMALADSDALLAQQAVNLLRSRLSEKIRQQVLSNLLCEACEAGPKQELAIRVFIGSLGNLSLSEVQRFLHHGTAWIRRQAVSVLPALGGSLTDLRPLLNDPDASVRWSATEALPALGGSMADLYPLLSDPDASVRTAAVKALPALGGSMADLYPLPSDTAASVIGAAVEALPALGGSMADLYPLLSDPDTSVRWSATEILPELIENLTDLRPLLSDPDEWVRRSAVEALPKLIENLTDLRLFFVLANADYPAVHSLTIAITSMSELSEFYWLRAVSPSQFEEIRVRFGLPKNWQPPFGWLAGFFGLLKRIGANLMDAGLAAPLVCAGLIVLFNLFSYELLITSLCTVTVFANLIQLALFERTLGLRLVACTLFTKEDKEWRYWTGQGVFWLTYYLFLLNLPALLNFATSGTADLVGISMGLLSMLFLLADGAWAIFGPYRQTLHDVISETYLVRYR